MNYKERKTQERIAEHIANLGSEDKNTAYLAETYLVRYYGRRAFDQLSVALQHSNPQVRYRAAWVLGYTHDPRAFDLILPLLEDPDPEVRYDAAIALGILGDQRSVAPLIARIHKRDEEHYVDAAAADGLVRLGQLAVPALLESLSSKDSWVRICAAYALGSIADPRAIEPLRKQLADPDEGARLAAEESLEVIEAR